MRALIRRDLDDTVPECDVCQTDNRVRAEYGCDGPAKLEVFHILCSKCTGDPECEKCHGTGTVRKFRCPGKLLEKYSDMVPDLVRTVGLYRQYEAHGLLPCPGSLLDQPELLMRALSICSAEHAAIQREEGEERDKKKSMADLQAKTKSMSKNAH